MMQTDVKSAHVEAIGTMVAYRTRIRGYIRELETEAQKAQNFLMQAQGTI